MGIWGLMWCFVGIGIGIGRGMDGGCGYRVTTSAWDGVGVGCLNFLSFILRFGVVVFV